MHCNVRTEIRLAAETGYDAYEIVDTKLLRYLDQGYTAEDLKTLLDRHRMPVVTINALKWIERRTPTERKAMLDDCRRLCAAAAVIKCPTIQLVPFCDGMGDMSVAEIMRVLVENVTEIADIGRPHGVRFQLEPIAWAPVRSLRHCLELIERVGRGNVGMVIDFWHLWAGELTTPAEVAALDSRLIYGVHFCDGKRIPKAGPWTEEGCRGYLPGEGDIPIDAWVQAVRATGYDGSWSSELLSPRHWEWDLWDVARECRSLMLKYLTPAVAAR
jgi:sugar phosphate isomerase/epimerase